MIRFFVLVVLTCMVGCEVDKPAANLTFSSIQKAHKGYVIEFYSDIDIDSLFSSEHTRKIISRQLVCALENDRDFSVEHNMAKFFGGDVELQEGNTDKSGKKHRYLSNGLFYFNFDEGSRFARLAEDEVIDLISNTAEIDCKVVMTVFLSKPYYSATMKIPAREVVRLMKANQGSLRRGPDRKNHVHDSTAPSA